MVLDSIRLACLDCDATWPGNEVRYRCDCGGTLDAMETAAEVPSRETLDARRASSNPIDRSGVWRFRELILDVDDPVTRHEGNTGLHVSPRVASWCGLDALALKHEGENPTGSFKDRGMTAGVTAARLLGATRVACASTGNTSASMASYAAVAGMESIVFIPEGQIAYGKLSQALAYGARTLQIAGDFDRAMTLVQEVCARENIYLLNSVNPFRIEGQKAIGFELMQDREWKVPDWLVMPGGNLGNSSAIAKGLSELHGLGLIDRLPRLAIIQAAGANPLATAFRTGETIRPVEARTLATAIKIGNPVSWKKCLRGVDATEGVVTDVTDQQIMDAKAVVDASGIGAEPASCATVAGVRRLVDEGVIPADADVCGILTGHLLKDPDAVIRYHRGELEGITSSMANAPIKVEADFVSVARALDC